MEEKSKVVLHGRWASPYPRMIEIALKLKGIPYEYVEEDAQNKSQKLLQLNPIYEKVPILVHDGKVIIESLLILEYIDETWKNTPKLLPEDPYERAQARFWFSYFTQEVFESTGELLFKEGEALAKALKETCEKINVLEEGLKKHFPMDQDSISNVGILDIILVSTFGVHEAYSEGLGVEVVDPVNTPIVFSRVERLREIPKIKEVLPPCDKLGKVIKNFRQGLLEKAKNVTSN